MPLRWTIFLAWVGVATGLAAQTIDPVPPTRSGALPSPRPDLAQVVVFRPPGFLGIALGCTVMSSETEIARLGPGRFRVVDQPAGRLTLLAREGKIPVELELHAGKRTFVQCSYGRGITRGAPDLVVVDQSVFAAKAARLKGTGERVE